MKIKISAIAALTASLAVAASASAAPAAAPASGGVTLNGPAIPGMCVLSQGQLVHDSALGKAIATRLGQLKNQVAAEINAEATTLQTDERTFETGRASMTPDQQQKQGGALAAREQALQQKYQLRTQEMEATEQKALGYLGQQANPIVGSVAVQHNCSVLLSGGVVATTPSMDITTAVIQQLDARVQTYAFDREHLDTQGAAAPAR